ncbi:MAG TPA: hypothetical protein VN754_03910 [Candidatus Binataceae bacterium]|nr:hypothetical protein [Candidatus Binataceae bacterium]
MSEPTLLKTARGVYRLSVAEESWSDGGACTLTLAAEHAGGLEKFGFRCRIAESLAGTRDKQAICARLAGWLEGQFEAVREAALKSVRSERRLAEFEFDASRPGPFKVIT